MHFFVEVTIESRLGLKPKLRSHFQMEILFETTHLFLSLVKTKNEQKLTSFRVKNDFLHVGYDMNSRCTQ